MTDVITGTADELLHGTAAWDVEREVAWPVTVRVTTEHVIWVDAETHEQAVKHARQNARDCELGTLDAENTVDSYIDVEASLAPWTEAVGSYPPEVGPCPACPECRIVGHYLNPDFIQHAGTCSQHRHQLHHYSPRPGFWVYGCSCSRFDLDQLGYARDVRLLTPALGRAAARAHAAKVAHLRPYGNRQLDLGEQ